MYIPRQFDQQDIAELHRLMRELPLATLVGTSADGLTANHIPLYLVDDGSAFGVLRGHVARANPLWSDLQNADVLAIFHGPQAYISPSWYATKQEGGKVVPTWNYAVVHAHGKLRAIDDAAWIRAQMTALTAQQEARFDAPWAVSDAPPDFTDKLIGAVVGIEIVIARLQGKWKVSQNQPEKNRQTVVQGLTTGDESDTRMASLVKQHGRDCA